MTGVGDFFSLLPLQHQKKQKERVEEIAEQQFTQRLADAEKNRDAHKTIMQNHRIVSAQQLEENKAKVRDTCWGQDEGSSSGLWFSFVFMQTCGDFGVFDDLLFYIGGRDSFLKLTAN